MTAIFSDNIGAFEVTGVKEIIRDERAEGKGYWVFFKGGREEFYAARFESVKENK